MARDYKSRAQPQKSRQREPVSGWVWFVSGLLLGLLICGLVWLKLSPQSPDRVAPVATVKPQAKAVKKESKEAATAKPRFDFYTILPEMEVVVPDPEPVTVTPPVSTTGDDILPAVVDATAAADYMLQMGSFRKLTDADRLKASMALVGLEAEIQKVTINGGEIFHRVRSGPYTRKQVNVLRTRLKENRINSLVIKLKQ